MSSAAPDRKRGPAPLRSWGSLVCALLLPCLLQPVAAADSDRTIKQSEEDLQKAKARIEALNRQLARERDQKTELGDALEASERKLADAQAQLLRVRREVAEQNKRIVATQAQAAEAAHRLEQQKEALAQQVRAAYVMGSRAQTQVWLSQEDTARTGRVLTDFDYVNRARADQVAAVKAETAKIELLKASLVEERVRLESLEQEQAQTLVSMQKSRDERRRTIAQIDQQINDSADELKSAQAEEKQMQKLLESLKSALADIPADLDHGNKPFGQLKGKLGWPLRGPILADFGSPKAGGRLTWTGRWIGGKDGAPVRAIARGRVAYVGWLQRNGLIVILEHDGGYFTLYGHCSTAAPSAGEWVEAGQVIATAGDTGGHDDTGVYLEIRKGSNALDTREWMGK